MSIATDNSEAAILSRVFSPEEGRWSPAAAEAILALGFSERDAVRMSELLAKAKGGEISEEEVHELTNYRHIGKLLELMKSRARRSLKAA